MKSRTRAMVPSSLEMVLFGEERENTEGMILDDIVCNLMGKSECREKLPESFLSSI